MKQMGQITKTCCRIGFLILFIISFSSCKTSKPIVEKSPVPIYDFAFNFVKSDNLTSVLKQAKNEGKLVFVDVYTTWCLPCKMMDQHIFTDQKTADLFNERFISYKVDAEKSNGPIISFNYDVIEFPTLLFLDSNGKILERKEGATNLSELVALANNALDQVTIGE